MDSVICDTTMINRVDGSTFSEGWGCQTFHLCCPGLPNEMKRARNGLHFERKRADHQAPLAFSMLLVARMLLVEYR